MCLRGTCKESDKFAVLLMRMLKDLGLSKRALTTETESSAKVS